MAAPRPESIGFIPNFHLNRRQLIRIEGRNFVTDRIVVTTIRDATGQVTWEKVPNSERVRSATLMTVRARPAAVRDWVPAGLDIRGIGDLTITLTNTQTTETATASLGEVNYIEPDVERFADAEDCEVPKETAPRVTAIIPVFLVGTQERPQRQILRVEGINFLEGEIRVTGLADSARHNWVLVPGSERVEGNQMSFEADLGPPRDGKEKPDYGLGDLTITLTNTTTGEPTANPAPIQVYYLEAPPIPAETGGSDSR